MEDSTNIFIQIDTESVLYYGERPSEDQVSAHTLIYNQGSMALGNAVKDFGTNIYDKQDIYFTILPLKLFSNHKIYLTDFKVLNDPGDKIKFSPAAMESNCVTFKITIEAGVPDAELTFGLYAIIQHVKDNKIIETPIYIDPVLRIKQRI